MSPLNNNAQNVPNLLGAAKISEISEDGEIVDVITGLTMVTGIAFDLPERSGSMAFSRMVLKKT